MVMRPGLSGAGETDLMELSLEELVDIEVTSVSKRTQKLSESAAAVFVITQEDLKRSGVTNIPDALRMAPGIQVAQIDANMWAVSARGFNDRFANKMLVLIDGRSVYNPLFSGTYWDVQNLIMEDIDRIEIIRGPGASMWGANAVNGVINIITKEVVETEGGLIAAGAGQEERGYAALRYGGELENGAHYRLHGRFFARDDFVDGLGEPGADDWNTAHGGFRLDWSRDQADRVSIQGAAYRGTTGERLLIPSLDAPYVGVHETDHITTGGHLLSRWDRRLRGGSELTVQTYYDRTSRDAELTLGEVRNTVDVDAMHRLYLGQRQELSWGFGYRATWDDLRSTFNATFTPDARTDHLVSGFFHDKISLGDGQAYLSFGTKLEHNDYTGFEVQPSARVSWKLGGSRTLWGAVSRAVRTPARGEVDARLNQQVIPPGTILPDAPAAVVSLIGNRDFESEELLAYEAGYRSYPRSWLALDIAGFHNVYEKLRSIEPGLMTLDTSLGQPLLVIPFTAGNNLQGTTRGLEAVVELRPTSQWRLTGAYSFLDINLELVNNSLDPTSLEAEEQSPEHQLSIRSSLDLTRSVAFDLGFRYVGALPAMEVDPYTVMDFRIGWEASPGLDLALVGRNLLKDHHAEFASSLINTIPTEVEPSIYGTLAWRIE
jgi:iron complex outermembrane receptor protein